MEISTVTTRSSKCEVYPREPPTEIGNMFVIQLAPENPSRGASRGHPEAQQPALVQLAAATASCLQNEAATHSRKWSATFRQSKQ
eukprot:scaffold103628_cov33-Phaeocystis_antarctica.AAC.1